MENTDQANPELESKLLSIYQDLKEVLRRDDLAPGTRANAVQALACMAMIVNDLALEYEMLYDLGV
jgi:hypothetical protein